MSITTFGSSNINPFVIKGAGNPPPVAPPVMPPVMPPVVGPPGTPPLVAAPGTPPVAGVLYANGVLVENVHTLVFNGNSKQFAECTCNGKKIWVDLSAFSPERIPKKIAENLTEPSTAFTQYIIPNNTPLGARDNSLPNGFLFETGSTAAVIQEAGMADEWYGYKPSPSYNPLGLTQAFIHNDTVVSPAGLGPGGIIVPPPGRNFVALSQKAGTATIPGGHVSQNFSNKVAALLFAGQYPGATITNNSTTAVQNNVNQAHLSGLLSQGWHVINAITKWNDVPGLMNILQGSPQYNQYINDSEYQWMQTGTKKVLVKTGTPPIKFDDIDLATLNNLKAQNPDLTWNQDGFFTSTSTETYPDTGILENSDLFNDLTSKGWKLMPTGEFDIKTTKQIVDTKKDLTLDQAKALGGDWKYVANGKTKTITTQVGTSKTVSLTGLTAEQIKEHMNKTGYKIVKEYDVNHPTDPVVEHYKVDNKTGGLWGAEGIDVGDGSGTLTGAGLKASYDKSTYKVNSLFAKPAGLNPNDMFVDKNTAIDKKDSFMFAGDPEAWDMGGFEGGPLDDAAHVDIHPDADIYNVVNGGSTKFKFSVNQAIEPINNEGNVAARMYGYVFNFDGEEFKLAVKDGQATLTKPDGSTQVIDPKVGLKLPAGANPALVEISEATIAGAGFNGASEKRLNIRFAELASDDVVAKLKNDGFTEAEIFEKTTNWNTVHHGFRVPKNTSQGAYTSDSSGTAVPTPEGDDGVKTYYDTHWLVEKPDKVFAKTTTGTNCEKKFDIEYTEICNETKTEEVPLYDATLEKECEVKTPKYKATKDTVKNTEKFDACVPGTPDEYNDVPIGKFQKSEKCYDLQKTTDCWRVDADTPDRYVDCWDDTQTGSPLAIDISGDGVLTETQSTLKEFDLDGDGTTEKYKAWFQANDAVLAFDTNKNGTIDNGGELFGDNSNFIEDKTTNLFNGYDALRAFANQVSASIDDDGRIDQGELALLEDAGLVATVGNEIKKLSELGVTELSLDATQDSYAEASGAILDPVSSAIVNGEERVFADAWFSPEAEEAAEVDSTATTASGDAEEDVTTTDDTPVTDRPKNSLPWERNNYANPWSYNNPAAYGLPMPNFSSEFAPGGYGAYNNAAMNSMQQMMLASMGLGGGMPTNSYGYQQQQQVLMQQQQAAYVASMVQTLLMAFMMPTFGASAQQQPYQQPQQTSYNPYPQYGNNPFGF